MSTVQVTQLNEIIPLKPFSVDPAISSSLASLQAAAAHFETECRILILRSQSEPLQQSFVTQQVGCITYTGCF